MTTADLPSLGPRFDRVELQADLAAGALLLAVVAAVAWPLALVGAGYLVVASGFLAAVAVRDDLTRSQQVLARAVPWLLAVGLWAALLAAPDGNPSVLGALGGGLVVVTPAYAVWQLVALAVRQALLLR